MKHIKKIVSLLLTSALATATLSGCGKKAVPIGYENSKTPTIIIMTTATRTTPAGPDSPVVQEIERILGEKMTEKYKDVYGQEYDKVHLDINWVATTAYGEKVTATLGSEEYPQVMLVTTRNSSIIQNSKHGTFWDITDAYTKTDEKYITEDNPEGYVYPNLAKSNKNTLRNIMVDGRIYGIYRARTVGRQGVTIRKDWLENVGLDIPQTVDEFEEVLRAFKEDDPDGNGKDDTYGMIITTYLDGPLGNLAIWLGAPNQWGYDEENGEWRPWFMSEAYFKALSKLREWYAKGYINKNMATLDSNKWDEDFLKGNAGVQVDVADRASKNQRNIAKTNANARVDVFGYVKADENAPIRTWPTNGHGGYYVFPKSAVPTEKDLDFILSVLDECNSEEIVDLCNYGIPNVHYVLDGEGKAMKFTSDNDLKAHQAETGIEGKYAVSDYTDLPQFSMGVVPTELRTSYTSYLDVKVDFFNLNTKFTIPYTNEVEKKLQYVYDDNENYAVINPMEPYTSESYSMSGTQLDAIKGEAEVNYITGKIDEAGYKAAMEQWMKMDGRLVCQDYKEAYEADESNYEDGQLVIPDEYKYSFKF